MTTANRIAEELRTYAYGPNATTLPSLAHVEVFDGGWVSEASGNSVAWLADVAGRLADVDGYAVRIVSQPSGEVLFKTLPIAGGGFR